MTVTGQRLSDNNHSYLKDLFIKDLDLTVQILFFVVNPEMKNIHNQDNLNDIILLDMI